jgi:cell division protein FtsX
VSPRWLLRRTGRRLRRDWRGFLPQAAAFVAIAALGSAAHILQRQSALGAARLAGEAHLIAYLDDGLSVERAESLRSAFARLPSVTEVRQVDGARALSELSRQLRGLGEGPDAPTVAGSGALSDLEAGFLPTSLEIVLAPGLALEKRTTDVAIRLRRLPGVSAVDALTEGMDRLAAFQALARRLARFFGAAAIAAAVILGAALVARERRRRLEEARALAQIGASPASLWIPASLVSALAALVGGAVGLGLGRALGATLFDPGLALDPVPARAWLGALAILLATGLLVGRLSIPGAKVPHVI